MKKVFYSQAQNQGQRIDIYLSKELFLSRSQIKNLITKGKIWVNGIIVNKSGLEIKNNMTIEVELENKPPLKAFAQNIPLDIVYEDEQFAVINKPQGMVTHPSETTPKDTLVNAAMHHIKELSQTNGDLRQGIVHRLDKGTSGLLIIAKTDEAHLSLAKQIADKTALRFYLGLVHGNIKEDSGQIEAPLARHSVDRKKIAVAPHGRYAKTLYKVMERFMDYTLVEFQLSTGRTHQIRVHCKSLQHPIVGDKKYGVKEKFTLKSQLLHAYKLVVKHPLSGEEMSFTAPIFDHFQRFLDVLR